MALLVFSRVDKLARSYKASFTIVYTHRPFRERSTLQAQLVSPGQRTGMAGRNASDNDVEGLRPLCKECLDEIGPEALYSKKCFMPNEEEHKKAAKKVKFFLICLTECIRYTQRTNSYTLSWL